MKEITLEDLLAKVACYNVQGVDKVRRAYSYASYLHGNQTRKSGEAYIIHPLNVAYTLALLRADVDTIVAGLLHDTLEDTDASKEDITLRFGKDVGDLVDGVTKIGRINFSDKVEQNMFNTRKIISGIMSDFRIIVIKLADRLHNMRTLEFLSEKKQKENAEETLEIFAPFAYLIGARNMKMELENLAFSYLHPDDYKRFYEIREEVILENTPYLREMMQVIQEKLTNQYGIVCNMELRFKNLFGIYREALKRHPNNPYQICLDEIHDLMAIKILVKEKMECYQTMGVVHDCYFPYNPSFKDYLCSPKKNMYSSLHTTVFGKNKKLVQSRITTYDREVVNSLGIMGYCNLYNGKSREEIQNKLKEEYQFYTSLVEIDQAFVDNRDFVRNVKMELFSDKVYVYDIKGNVIEFPKGATLVDFAYYFGSEFGDYLAYGIVNDEEVSWNYVLKNNDRVNIVVGERRDYSSEGESLAITTLARRRLLNGKFKR